MLIPSLKNKDKSTSCFIKTKHDLLYQKGKTLILQTLFPNTDKENLEQLIQALLN